MDAVSQLAAGRDTYVLYDPEHTSSCDIDRERLRVEFGPGRNGKDRVVILTAAQAQFEDKLTARERDPVAYAERRRDMLGRAAAAQAHAQAHAQAIMEAVQAGDFSEVERLKTLLATGGASEHPAGPGSVAPGVSGPEDPLERLQKLADLHDRGALTDAEFAAEKASANLAEASRRAWSGTMGESPRQRCEDCCIPPPMRKSGSRVLVLSKLRSPAGHHFGCCMQIGERN